MAGLCAQAAVNENNSSASRSESPTASTSDGSSGRRQARAVQLAEAAREPVNSWLSSSPCAFMHGSESAGGVQRGWTEDHCSPERRCWDAARPSEPVSSTHTPADYSFETHPFTLCFKDRTVRRLFDGHRAACASQAPYLLFGFLLTLYQCLL